MASLIIVQFPPVFHSKLNAFVMCKQQQHRSETNTTSTTSTTSANTHRTWKIFVYFSPQQPFIGIQTVELLVRVTDVCMFPLAPSVMTAMQSVFIKTSAKTNVQRSWLVWVVEGTRKRLQNYRTSTALTGRNLAPNTTTTVLLPRSQTRVAENIWWVTKPCQLPKKNVIDI